MAVSAAEGEKAGGKWENRGRWFPEDRSVSWYVYSQPLCRCFPHQRAQPGGPFVPVCWEVGMWGGVWAASRTLGSTMGF